VFWSVFYTFWSLLAAYFRGNLDIAVNLVIPNIVQGKPYYHLWYLFMLPMMYLITSYVRTVIHNTDKNNMVLLVCICLGISAIATLAHSIMGESVARSTFFTTFVPYIGYFLLGGVLNRFKVKVSNKLCMSLLAIV
jgi:surface polysaccharide O-acyltransferase-like enzyme